MSFNSNQLQQMVNHIRSEDLGPLAAVEFFDFPLAGILPDLNLGLRFKTGKVILISFRSPWTGLFLVHENQVRPSKQIWRQAFGDARFFGPSLSHTELQKVTAFENDRRVRFEFTDGASLEVHLFPARPNWIYSKGETTIAWRALTAGAIRPTRAPIGPSTDSAVPTGAALAPEDIGFVDGAFEKYRQLREKALVERVFQQACQIVETELAKVAKLRNEMRGKLAESRKAGQVKANAEALKAVLYAYPRQQKSSRIPEVDVDLDPTKTLAENAEDFFQKYKKLVRTEREVEVRVVAFEERTKQFTESLARLRALPKGSENRQAVRAILQPLGLWKDFETEAESDGKKPERPPGKNEKKWAKTGARSFFSAEGLKIWIGQNKEENEELVIRLARGNDVWMHVKTRPGSHAIVQVPKNKTASLETLLDAATLVAFFSGAEKGAKADVDYTFRKNVKRVPGGGKGGKGPAHFQVTYTHNKTLSVQIDTARLDRLFASVGLKS